MEMLYIKRSILFSAALVLVLTFSSEFTFAGKTLNHTEVSNSQSNPENSFCQECPTQQSFEFLRFAESKKGDSSVDISDIYNEPTAYGESRQMSENERIHNQAKSAWERGSRALIFDDEGNIVRPYGITATPFHLMFGELD